MSLKINGLNVSYGKNHILRDIKLDIEKGEFISILGKSGCGDNDIMMIVQ